LNKSQFNVSIITVCFNSEKTLEKTILSVLNQSYVNIEYIIIDGGSTDGTIDIIKSNVNKFSNNLIWISESDNGIYDAINKGISLASGDLIGILNSDDIFFNQLVIEEIVNFHLSHKIDASIGNVVQIDSRNKIIRGYNSKSWVPSKLKIGFMPPHPSIFIRRDIFSKLGMYKIDYKIAADYELIIRFFLIHKITWKYSNITTTSMLIGGVSSSGVKSYNIVTEEISKALKINSVKFSKLILRLRIVWKVFELFKK
jgi:glycosyltransferase involved in cell wall biosynthesis